MLSAQELLAGGALTFDIDVPAAVLSPGTDGASPSPGKVRIRPLTVADLQRVARAAKDSDTLCATLLVQQALVEPALGVAEVAAMHAGLLEYLLRKVNELSGISVAPEDLATAIEDPLTRAAFVLAREYGWTPQQVNALTLGQILLNLQMLRTQHARDHRPHAESA